MSEAITPNNEPSTAGWDAITAALKSHYPSQQPRHWGTLLHARIGGSSFLDGISAYLHEGGDQPRHWHYISFGMSELYDKETKFPEESGWGFEFTFRLAAPAGETEPPQWPLSLLENLARYVNTSGNAFAPGHYVPLNGPISLEAQTKIHAALFTLDPVLETIQTPNGSLGFLQIVGATMDELAAARAWKTESFLGVMKSTNPLLITDLARDSILTDPRTAAAVAEGTARDGSSSGSSYTDTFSFSVRKRFLRSPQTVITVGANSIEDLRAQLVGRIPFQRPFSVIGPEYGMNVSPGDRVNATVAEEKRLELVLSPKAAADIAAALKPIRGEYTVAAAPELVIQVVPTEIRDAKGEQVTQVIG
ncbi:MAG: suppressor of fused domain protein [Phycisphaerales bacterium]